MLTTCSASPFILTLSLVFLSLAASSCSPPGPGGRPADGKLAPCPPSPNCVSSQSEDPKHRTEPLRFTGPPEAALDVIAGAVEGMARARVVLREDGFMAAEFRSRLGFVDDVHFLIDAEAGLVHIRSASRVGYWDLGVNRRRVRSLRRALEGRL